MGAAKEARDRASIRARFDRESEGRERTGWPEAARMLQERDDARAQIRALVERLGAAQAELDVARLAATSQAEHIAAITEALGLANERAEQAPAHYKALWQEARADYCAAVLRYQQLKTIALCGISQEYWEIAKTEAQIYYPHVEWRGVETMDYPRPPLFGYAKADMSFPVAPHAGGAGRVKETNT